MKTVAASKIEKAVEADGSRPAIADPYLLIDKDGNAFLCATDSYQLVMLPVELDDGDVTGYVPVEAIKAARRLRRQSIRLEEHAAVVEDFLFVAHEARYARNPTIGVDQRKFPDVLALVEKFEKSAVLAEVGINVKILTRLAAALGCDQVQLSVRGPHEPISVVGANSLKARGLLMPVLVRG